MREASLVFLLVFSAALSRPGCFEDERTHRLKELERTADRLTSILRSSDAEAFLELIAPRSLTIGPDQVALRPAIDQELRERKGETYGILFGEMHSFRSILLKKADIQTRLGFSHEYRLDETTGRIERVREILDVGGVVYRWHGAPAEEGMMDFPGFGMIYYEGRWLVGELFH